MRFAAQTLHQWDCTCSASFTASQVLPIPPMPKRVMKRERSVNIHCRRISSSAETRHVWGKAPTDGGVWEDSIGLETL
jgi:hypothetical protein